MSEAQRLETLATLARRRRLIMAGVQAVSLGLVVAAPLRFLTGMTILPLVAGTLAAVLAWFRLDARARRIDARAVARYLDGQFPALADSTELLLSEQQAADNLLLRVQVKRTEEAFRELDDRNSLREALPPFPAATAAGWLAAATAVALGLAVLGFGGTGTAKEASERTASVTAVSVAIKPLSYTGHPEAVVRTLDFSTYADASVRWEITLSASTDEVSLVFHNGDDLPLEAAGGGRWRSPEWSAFSTAYRINADGAELPGHFHRVTVTPDEPPAITVSAPEEALQVLPPAADSPTLTLALSATDDYGLTAANARVTLARGTGEQVRFREKSLPLALQLSDDKRSLSAEGSLDLVALGMERGDEMFVFAEVTDNRPASPNVATTSTFIVRWPADDVLDVTQVASVAVNVMPDYFRSQRQIIIDTEALLAERDQIDEQTFADRAQDLAIDQKLLRLRYGQFLGEEAESALVDFAAAAAADYEDEHGEEHGDEHESEHEEEHDDDHEDESEEDHEDEHEDESEEGHEDDDEHGLEEDTAHAAVKPRPPRPEHDHDHAGHEEMTPDIPVFGDAAAAIAPYAHLHDTAEHATLFDPTTRDLLKQALAQMWEAELKLRLAEASPALPYEYSALELIKRVQHSSRIYLRRTGFQPTPVDEARRLTGELDEIDSRTRLAGAAEDSESSRLRRLFEALNQPYDTLPASVTRTAPLLQQLAARDSQWLDALRAVNALQADPECRECAEALSAALWRGLDGQVAMPGGDEALPSPLTQAFRERALAPLSR